MSVFDDDDEQEQGTPGSRVAAALNAVEDEEPADDGADTRADSQKDAKQQAQKDAPESNSAEDVANASSSFEGVSHPPEEQINADEDQGPDESLATNYAGFKPVAAPQAPTLQPLSNAPLESAQELANAKSAFASRQAAGEFKPSVGRQIRGRIAAGLIGFGAHNAGEGIRAGDEVLNAPLDKAKQVEAAKESGIQSQIDEGNQANARTQQENATALQNYGLQERDFRNRSFASHENALAEQEQATAAAKRNAITNWTPKDPNNPYLGGTGRTADGRTVENVPPPDKWVQQWAKTPEGIASSLRMTTDARRKVADSIFGKGNTTEKQEYVATGKISRAARVSVPSAQKEEFDDWKSAFQKENGRAPNAAEIQGWGHGKSGAVSKNLMDRIESQKNTKIASAQSDYRKGVISKDDYLSSWQEAQDDYEERLHDATGEDIPHVTVKDNVDPNTLEWHGKAPAQPKPQQQPQQQASQPAAKPAPQQQPQQAQPQQQPKPLPPPSKAQFNVGKWKQANPKGDPNAAIQAAKKAGYAIVGQ